LNAYQKLWKPEDSGHIKRKKKKKNTNQPRILYLAKLTFKNEEIKAFVDKPKADSLLSVDLP
jgi:hypothetical protein